LTRVAYKKATTFLKLANNSGRNNKLKQAFSLFF